MKSAPATVAILPPFLRRSLSPVRLFVGMIALATIAAAVLPTGCAHRAKPVFNGVTEDVDMPDIPVPFEFRRLSSWAYDEFDFRSWHGRYSGKMRLPEAADFYHHQMPKEGWLLRSSYPGATRRVLVFSKGTEEQAVVDIRRQWDTTIKSYLTVVAVDVKPTPSDELAVDAVLPEREDFTPAPTQDRLETGQVVENEAIPASQGDLEDDATEEQPIGR